MALNFATLKARALRDPRKCARLLDELSNLILDVTALEETHFTHFTCAVDCRVLEGDCHPFTIRQPQQPWGLFAY